MNTPETKRLSETVSSAASMTLFLLFAVCCLVMIAVAASAYSRISNNYDNTFSGTSAVRYVTNKIRACESAEVLSENGLLLKNSGFSTLIYYKNGCVYERLFTEEQIPIPEGGEEMFKVGNLMLSEENGMITVTAEGGGNTFTACCRSAKGGGGNAKSV